MGWEALCFCSRSCLDTRGVTCSCCPLRPQHRTYEVLVVYFVRIYIYTLREPSDPSTHVVMHGICFFTALQYPAPSPDRESRGCQNAAFGSYSRQCQWERFFFIFLLSTPETPFTAKVPCTTRRPEARLRGLANSRPTYLLYRMKLVSWPGVRHRVFGIGCWDSRLSSATYVVSVGQALHLHIYTGIKSASRSSVIVFVRGQSKESVRSELRQTRPTVSDLRACTCFITASCVFSSRFYVPHRWPAFCGGHGTLAPWEESHANPTQSALESYSLLSSSLLLSLLLLLLLSYIIIILLFRFFTAGQSTRHRKHLHPTSFHFAPHSRAFVSSIRLLVVCCLQLFEEGEKYSSNESRGWRV